MELKINWIKGKNCVGKTTLIRKMLGYEEESYYKYTPNTPERYSLDNNNFNIIEVHHINLIVRMYLKKKCKKCNEIIKINQTIKGQKKKVEERESNFFKANEIMKLIVEKSKEIKEIQKEIKELNKKTDKIKNNSKINLEETAYYLESELEENNWYEYYEINQNIKKLEEQIVRINTNINDYSQESKKLKDRRGYTNLKESYEFNNWRLIDYLISHSIDHNIDIYITILAKEDLITLFQKIDKMKINRLYLEKLVDFWLVAELEEKFEHYISFNPPIKAILQFPQNINELYIETNSLDDKVVIEAETLKF
jgi:cell division protein FtsL